MCLTDLDAVHAVLDETVPPLVDDLSMIGLSLGVVADGRLVATCNHGLADVRTKRPADPSTIYRIGSISKTFTGIAVMQLVEQGRIALDDPMARHLRSFRWVQPSGTRPATVRDALTHTAGVGEVDRLSRLRDLSLFGLGVREGRAVPPLSEYYRGKLRSDIAPGQKWAYANHAFAALGQVVEDVSGLPFERYARERVFAPLGMTGTDFVLQPEQRPRLAVGYALKGARVQPVPWREIVVRPAGSAFSSVEQLALYTAALMSGGANEHGRALESGTLAEMFRPHWRRHPALPGQGLAFLLEDIDGHRVVWHDGGWPGFVSAMLVAPDARFGVIALTNSGANAHAVADAVLRRLLGVPALGAPEQRRRVPASPHLWADLVGVYAPPRGGTTNLRLAEFGFEVDVAVRRGHLVASSPVGPLRGGVRLYAADPDDPLVFETVVQQRGAPRLLRLVFLRDADGRVDELTGTLLLQAGLRRRPALRAASRIGALAAATAGVAVTTAAAVRLRRRPR